MSVGRRHYPGHSGGADRPHLSKTHHAGLPSNGPWRFRATRPGGDQNVLWLLLLIIATWGCVAASQAKADPIYNITFHVRDQADNQPLDGVQVRIRDQYEPKYLWQTTTDANGIATVSADVLFTSIYIAEMHKDGYVDAKPSLELKQRQLGEPYHRTVTLTPFQILLTKAAGVKVHVHVQALDDNQPVVDARVNFSPFGNGDFVGDVGSTDDAGNISLFLPEGGSFDVSVTHSNFEPATDRKEFNRYGEPANFTYALKRKHVKGEGFYLEVSVFGKTAANEEGPIPSASISTLGGSHATTDEHGFARLDLITETYGDQVSVTAEAEDYKPSTQRITLEQTNIVRVAKSNQGSLTFHLVPSDSQGSTVNLLVTVMDRQSDTPLENACVTIEEQNGGHTVGVGCTDAHGEVAIKFPFAEIAPGAGARLLATRDGFDNLESALLPERLLPSREPRGIPVYMKRLLDLAGQWCSTERPGSPELATSIDQNGHTLSFHNEHGSTATGHFETSNIIVADGWGGLHAQTDGTVINWSNASVWRRGADCRGNAAAGPASTPAAGNVNCLDYCLSQNGSISSYIPCYNHIPKTKTGTEQECKDATHKATVLHQNVN